MAVSGVVLGTALAGATSAGASPASNPPYYRQFVGPTCDHSATATPTATDACIQLDLAQINAARAQEGVKPMVLPSNYSSLTPGEQLFVAADLERVDRGIRAVVALTDQLDALAAQGAGHGQDPPFPPNHQWAGSVWAGGYSSTLEAIYAWMYDDGVGSSNGACTQAGDPGCWAHRTNILGNPTATMTGGAATGYGTWGTEYALLWVQSRVSTGNYVYTWAQPSATPTGPLPSVNVPPVRLPVSHPAPTSPAPKAAPAAAPAATFAPTAKPAPRPAAAPVPTAAPHVPAAVTVALASPVAPAATTPQAPSSSAGAPTDGHAPTKSLVLGAGAVILAALFMRRAMRRPRRVATENVAS